MNHAQLTRRGLLTAGGLAGVLTLAGCTPGNSSKQPAVPAAAVELLVWPAKNVWPEHFQRAPADVQEAYRYAVVNYDTLRWMPCFCGCGANGHVSNFDCYVREVRDDGSVLLDPMGFN